MPKLGVIVASTRPNRVGMAVAKWFVEVAKAHGKFDVELIDLLEVNLPPMDEPNHPMKRQYQHEHTKAWSARIGQVDAFAFVTPEYNNGPAPALVNAFNYLFHEWTYKAAGFVSYGGVSGGLRAVQSAKLILAAMKVVTLPEAVTLPFVHKRIEDGAFKSEPGIDQSATLMLDELFKWDGALKTLRS